MPKISKEKTLEQIKADILSKNICPDLAQTANQLVMGHGNTNADIVFIGEAPGKQEDSSGIPFVGAAGKLLDEMLGSINLLRSDVYITNIVKYRPPNNRDPSPEEKKAFWPYLLRELTAIKPKVIITLGRHSMGNFLPDVSISDVHGKVFNVNLERFTGPSTSITLSQVSVQPGSAEVDVQVVRLPSTGLDKPEIGKKPAVSAVQRSRLAGVKLVALYHPAAALYNGSLRQTLFNDFLIIKKLITN